jgi:hypothetical protein
MRPSREASGAYLDHLSVLGFWLGDLFLVSLEQADGVVLWTASKPIFPFSLAKNVRTIIVRTVLKSCFETD